MNEMEKRQKAITCLKWGILCLSLAVVCFFFEKPYAQTELREIIGKISNCFTVPGVLLSAIGGLSYVSYRGGYDGIGYAFSSFGLHNLWNIKQPKKYKTFYEYKESKDKKGRSWLPATLLVGLISLAIGALFMIIYCVL